MAKMFYTLDEAAQRLRKSADEVRDMANRGQIQEFRDRDKLMFKVEQIDLLAPPEEGDDIELSGDLAGDSGPIPLADSGMGAIDLASSGSSLALAPEGSSIIPLDAAPAPKPAPRASSGVESPKERSGISVFDVDDLEQADPSAVTQVTDGGMLDDAGLETVGSGSGLMDLTRESDDTSLGAAALLDEIYQGNPDNAATQETVGATGLFEAAGAESDGPGAGASALAGAGLMVPAEQIDGPWSGLTAGLSIGAVVACGVALFAAVLGAMGAPMKGALGVISTNMMIVVAAVAGITLIAGALGFVLGRRG